MTATALTTADGLAIYDLSQQAGELVAVAGPAGYAGTIDPDALPAGFRWISEEEWSEADQRRAEAYVSESSISPERASRILASLGLPCDTLTDYWVCTDRQGREFLVTDAGAVAENTSTLSWLGS